MGVLLIGILQFILFTLNNSNMKNYFCIAFFVATILFIGGCIIRYPDWRLIVKNETQLNIYVTPQNNTLEPEPPARLGFMLPEYLVEKGNSIKMKMTGGKHAWEDYINESPDKKLHLYIFSEDTLKKYTTEQVIEGKKYLKRIDISVDELKAKDWKIVYSDED
jgi:hypothetical protein